MKDVARRSSTLPAADGQKSSRLWAASPPESSIVSIMRAPSAAA